MNWSPVPIRDAGVVKSILLLALIFFGMIARFVTDQGPLKDVFLIIRLNVSIRNVKMREAGFEPANSYETGS